MLVEERASASAAICDAVNGLLATRLRRGDVVALYAAKGSEVDTAGVDGFARGMDLVVAYPRVVEGDRLLAFHRAGLGELALARFGLREPSADAPGVAIDEVAAFVVPGLAFDRAGGRIGWGRGHYDTTLAVAAPIALRVGLGYDCQMIDQVPREPHDIALHVIITEVATHVVE